MSITSKTAILLLVSFTTAAAQVFADPVREVEKEARSAVHGSCSVAVSNVATTASTYGQCTLISLMGQNYNGVVPEGKILVVEDVGGSCVKYASDNWNIIAIYPTPSSGRIRHLPLTHLSTAGSLQRYVISEQVRMYVRPGGTVNVSMGVVTNTATSTCHVFYQGHLVATQ